MGRESSEEEIAASWIPRGGPIYLPNMVGQVSTVPEFQSSYLSLLHDLETQSVSPSSSHQYDLSTDALKIYTDEELTDMAIKEAFKEDNLSLQQQDDDDDTLSLNEQSLILPHPENPTAENKRSTKRRRQTVKMPNAKKTTKKTVVKGKVKKTDEAYIAKVEQLAKLKQKQDEDKADVRLHCFSETWEDGEDASTSIEGFEKMQSLKSIDNYTLVKPSDIQGTVETLFPEVILPGDGKDWKNLQDEIMYLMDVSSEIQETLGRSYNVPDGLDEDHLMGELEALKADMGDETEADGMPSYLQPDRQSDYDDELNLPPVPTARTQGRVQAEDVFGLPAVPRASLQG